MLVVRGVRRLLGLNRTVWTEQNANYAPYENRGDYYTCGQHETPASDGHGIIAPVIGVEELGIMSESF